MYYGFISDEDRARNRRNSKKRSERQAAAKAKGTHTNQEWLDLLDFFDYRCLKCGRQEPEIVLQKDHVRHLYLGGCDCIVNLQPLCASCNAAKGAENWILKQKAIENWGLSDAI